MGEAEVSRGHSSRWSNDHPGQLVKANYRAKGRTEGELSGRKQGGKGNRNPKRNGRGGEAEGREEAGMVEWSPGQLEDE